MDRHWLIPKSGPGRGIDLLPAGGVREAIFTPCFSSRFLDAAPVTPPSRFLDDATGPYRRGF